MTYAPFHNEVPDCLAEPLSSRVRRYLRSCDLDSARSERVAVAVGVTPSTMRRRLSHEGTTFSALVDLVRRELALDALREPTACIKVLSEQLGFSEPCAFHRAFRRWTGTTPARYRQGLQSHNETEQPTAACA